MANEGASSLREVTNEVTKEKLAMLEKQREILKSHYTPILEKYAIPENKSSLKFLKEVYETLKNCPEGENPSPNATKDLGVFLNWIDVESEDDGLYFGTKQLVTDWISSLVNNIQSQIEKFEYACLYANAMTQYMDHSGRNEEAEKAEDYLKQKNQAIADFKKIAFSAPSNNDFNKDEFDELLNTKLFDRGNPLDEKQFKQIQSQMKDFCDNFSHLSQMNSDELKICISSLIQNDLTAKNRKATLKELQENNDALQEVVQLLNKRLMNYITWKWPAPVTVTFKRDMNGSFKDNMNEDVLTAILLHYIGAKWSIQMKSIFKSIYRSKIWKRGTGTIGDLYYAPGSIEGYRREFHQISALSLLPSYMENLVSSTATQETGKRGQVKGLTPVKIKEQLLHLISNEIHLNNALRPDEPLNIVQSELEGFGPSLIHEAVFSVMQYFGVTKEWLNFFKNFLEASLKIESEAVQSRARGTPEGHQLSTMFGECLLFVMELFVNRESELSIHRINQDFWFWSHREENVMKAWNAVKTFAKLAGLTLKEEKSGSTVCQGGEPDCIIHGKHPLPQGRIQCGFLLLYSDGVFRVNDQLLHPQVLKMRECLEKADSLMSWIEVHNRFLRLFIRNFGEPALTFQTQHVAQIMKKIKEILKHVHPQTNGDPVEALKLKFAPLLKNKDVMDSWIVWSVGAGGLSLYNPFLELVPLHEAYRMRDESEKKMGYAQTHFGAQLHSDKVEWNGLLEKSKERRARRAQYIPHIKEELEEETISDEEVYSVDGEKLKNNQVEKRLKRIDFVTRCKRYRETKWGNWTSHYQMLLKNISPETSCGADWRESIYLNQLQNRLGRNEQGFVDGSLVPLSLISAMQTERFNQN